jgi:hypothetical protein
MTQGVVYYNQGTKCVVRMLVSLYTLRKVYSGPVTLITNGPQPEKFLELMKRFNIDVLPIELKEQLHPLVVKSMLWRFTPYDLTMFIDADTAILKPIEEYFPMIEKHTFCTGNFANWRSNGGIIGRRVARLAQISSQEMVAAAHNYGPAVNTGVHGYTKDAPMLEEWEQMTRKAFSEGLSGIPDEVACQLLLPKYPHWVAPVEWGVSVRYGILDDNTIIVHYHGRKHTGDYPACALWKKAYHDYIAELPDADKPFMADPQGDRRLHHYLKSLRKAAPAPVSGSVSSLSNITYVTAVNPKYLDRLAANFPVWMRTKNIKEYNFICFINDIPLDDPRLNFLGPNVQRIAWDFPAESVREKMLSAFIFGAAKEVKTEKWVKLDADAFMKYTQDEGKTYEIPVEWLTYDGALFAHRWHYTKPGKFLVDLEKWSDTIPELKDKPRLFPEELWKDMEASKRYGHGRIASYFCVHNSEFVRMAAKLAGDRLPVPSHDTYLWFLAAKMGLKIDRKKLKGYISA